MNDDSTDVSGSSRRKRRGKTRVPAGVVGLSLSLAGAACTESSAAIAPAPQTHITNLQEVELVDVTLATFHVFDREEAARPQGEGRLRVAVCGTCKGVRCR